MSASSALADLEKVLRAPDAITRPNIKELLGRSASLGGNFAQIRHELVRGYRGYPALTDIIARELGRPSGRSHKAVHQSIKDIFRIDEMDRVLREHGGCPS
jgi:hypothetical protein